MEKLNELIEWMQSGLSAIPNKASSEYFSLCACITKAKELAASTGQVPEPQYPRPDVAFAELAEAFKPYSLPTDQVTTMTGQVPGKWAVVDPAMIFDAKEDAERNCPYVFEVIKIIEP